MRRRCEISKSAIQSPLKLINGNERSFCALLFLFLEIVRFKKKNSSMVCVLITGEFQIINAGCPDVSANLASK